MWHIGQAMVFSPSHEMSEMISEVIPICEAEKKSSKHIFFPIHRHWGYVKFSEIKRLGTPGLYQRFSVGFKGFIPGVVAWPELWQITTIYMSFFNESRWSPRSPIDLWFCDSDHANFHILMLCSQRYAIGVTSHKEDGFASCPLNGLKCCSLYMLNPSKESTEKSLRGRDSDCYNFACFSVPHSATL